MWLRALIICDDIRLEVGGTVSLIGVHADKLFAPPGDGEIGRSARGASAALGGSGVCPR